MKVAIFRTYGPLETRSSLFVMSGQEVSHRCKTIELPDLGNQKNFSCIPEGIYDVVKYNSPKHGDCFRVLNVPDRDNILIHKGNYAAGKHVDTLGCILPGEYFEDINNDGNIDVGGSSQAMKALLEILPKKFKLIIA